MVLGVKNPPANAGDIRETCLVLGSGRSPGGRHGNPLQCFCWKNLMGPGRLQSMGLQRVRHDWSNLTDMHACTLIIKNRLKWEFFPQASIELWVIDVINLGTDTYIYTHIPIYMYTLFLLILNT